MESKAHLFWYNIERDPFDYRRGDIVEYRGKRCKVSDRQYDRVDLAFQGIGTSRYSDELRLIKEYRHRFYPKVREYLSNLYYRLKFNIKYKMNL